MSHNAACVAQIRTYSEPLTPTQGSLTMHEITKRVALRKIIRAAERQAEKEGCSFDEALRNHVAAVVEKWPKAALAIVRK